MSCQQVHCVKLKDPSIIACDNKSIKEIVLMQESPKPFANKGCIFWSLPFLDLPHPLSVVDFHIFS